MGVDVDADSTGRLPDAGSASAVQRAALVLASGPKLSVAAREPGPWVAMKFGSAGAGLCVLCVGGKCDFSTLTGCCVSSW